MIHVTQANIGNAAATIRRAAIKRVTNRCAHDTISGWCELQQDERGWAIAQRPTATILGADTLCPIQAGPAWAVVAEKVTKIYDGKPKFSPPLHLVEGTFRRKWRLRRRPVHVINTHFVADFGRWVSLYASEQSKEWAALKTAVAAAHDKGYDVIVLGDFNIPGNRGLPKVHPDAVLVFRRGYDAGIAIPAKGRKVDVVNHDQWPLGVEPQHMGHAASVKFSRA